MRAPGAALRRIWTIVMNLRTYLLDLVFPPRCAFCHKIVESGDIRVCEHCKTHLPFTTNQGCQKKDFVKLCVAPFYYENDVRASLLRFKFGNTPSYAKVYAPYMAACIQETLADQWDVLSWVPVSRRRLRQRGYDQAEVLCRAVAEELDVTPVPLLIKHRHTKAQSSSGSAEKRKANIAGAYRLLDGADVKDCRILLIDDIITTGSTMSECARTLGIGGADSVVCATVARQRG